MKSVSEILDLSSQFLKSKQVDRSRRNAEDLLAHVLRCKRIDLYLQYDRLLIEQELSLMRELVKKCSSGEPLDYLLGEMEFFKCQIQVDQRALIPRPETEILVDLIVKKISSFPDLERKNLWDICTGSGCIGIALKKRFPELKVSVSDNSLQALQLTSENVDRNRVEIEICHGDLLEPFRGGKADMIVCNPPYVSEPEYFDLDPSVRDFEPKEALVGGVRGTEFYERLEMEMVPFLNHGALIFLEMGSGQGDALKKIFSSSVWRAQEVHKDWSGKERFFFLEMQ